MILSIHLPTIQMILTYCDFIRFTVFTIEFVWGWANLELPWRFFCRPKLFAYLVFNIKDLWSKESQWKLLIHAQITLSERQEECFQSQLFPLLRQVVSLYLGKDFVQRFQETASTTHLQVKRNLLRNERDRRFLGPQLGRRTFDRRGNHFLLTQQRTRMFLFNTLKCHSPVLSIFLVTWSEKEIPFLFFLIPFKFNSLTTIFFFFSSTKTGPQGPDADHLIVFSPLVPRFSKRENIFLCPILFHSFPYSFSGQCLFRQISVPSSFHKPLTYFFFFSLSLPFFHSGHILHPWNIA